MSNQAPGNQQQLQMQPGQPGFPPQQQFMMGPGASSTLPHFSQVWAGQNFTPQQVLKHLRFCWNIVLFQNRVEL